MLNYKRLIMAEDTQLPIDPLVEELQNLAKVVERQLGTSKEEIGTLGFQLKNTKAKAAKAAKLCEKRKKEAKTKASAEIKALKQKIEDLKLKNKELEAKYKNLSKKVKDVLSAREALNKAVSE